MDGHTPASAGRANAARLLALCLLVAALTGCETLNVFLGPGPTAAADLGPAPVAWGEYAVVTTGYCACEKCCDWKRDWLGRPVFTTGPNAGQPKTVGLTASGTMARRGTVAADPKYLPYGTHLFIPGYGYGVAEDRGGAIKGRRLDLFFPTHQEALRWGRRMVIVRILARPWLGLRPEPGKPPAPPPGGS
jgi:3D (Asp-Asp-Asp) domain-containing protein